MARFDGYIDADAVRQAVSVLQKDGAVFEVRTASTAGRKEILSGYFDNADQLLEALKKIDPREKNIYITLGEVKDYCRAKAQSNRFLVGTTTTSDPDIERYRWLFVDFDPKRPTGISATDEEVEKARLLCMKVLDCLKSNGWPEPITAFSGNGYHLFYRINVNNDADGRRLVERCLKALSMNFSTEDVDIDTTNYNPSRICKLHGTLAQKGANVSARPHRMSGIIHVPEMLEMVDEDLLRTLAEDAPKPPKPNEKPSTMPRQEFDVVDFMARHGMRYRELGGNDRAVQVYALDHCPFNSEHTNGDAKIFQYSDGRISFKCHHNSCRDYKWQDVRLLFEPDAYDKQMDDERFDKGWLEHMAQRAAEIVEDKQAEKKKKEFRKLKTATALMGKNIPDPVVYVGVDDEIPLLVEGTCILSAKPKLGKSWLALAMCLALARGDNFLGRKTKQCSTLYLDLETSESLQQKRLRKMLKGEKVPDRFYLETETDGLNNGFIDQIENYLEQDPTIGLVVVDVFQIIRSPAKGIKETEYEHAYRDIAPLNVIAQKYHISIILVCHDRKSVDPDDPFSNILGSTGLQGAASQMIIMFRRKKDDPIHISIKGKAIDGEPEINVKFENAVWEVVEGGCSAEREQAERIEAYKRSNVRRAVLAVIEETGEWSGRCGQLIHEAAEYGVGMVESAKDVGVFLNQNIGIFMLVDGVKVHPNSQGTGSKTYKLSKTTIGTIGRNEESPLVEWQEVSKINASEVPFL